MEIVPVKAFKDNYVWTLRNETHAAVVDPGEARPVLDYLGREKLKLANIGFAKAVEPDNRALSAREARDRKLREAGTPTVPSTLADEKATNPFLRCREPAVIDSANKYLGARIADPVRVFAAIRDWKNRF